MAPPLALRELFEAHLDAVNRMGRYLGVPENDLDDLVQDVFLVAHQRLHTFEGRSNPRSWLYGIALRVAHRHRRRGVRAAPELELPAAASPDVLIDEHRGRALLARLIETLPEEQRVAFVLREIEELPLREVAETIGCHISTAYYRSEIAKRRIERAARDLGERLRKEEER